jgi:biotin carboxyl carrier protein
LVTRRIVVNGRPVEVSLDPSGAFRADGREGTVSIVEAAPGVWSVLLDCGDTSRSFSVRIEPGACIVNGERILTEVDDPRAPKRRSAAALLEGRQTLAAAMPGKIVRVLVEPGDLVEAGQGVVVVEAMKMQNEVKSPKSGRVVSVFAEEGRTVTAGVVLAVIE